MKRIICTVAQRLHASHIQSAVGENALPALSTVLPSVFSNASHAATVSSYHTRSSAQPFPRQRLFNIPALSLLRLCHSGQVHDETTPANATTDAAAPKEPANSPHKNPNDVNVAQTSKPGKVAGYVLSRLKAGQQPKLQAKGAAAVYVATKAFIIASDIGRNTEGVFLAARFEPDEEDALVGAGMLLQQQPPLPDIAQPESWTTLRVKGDMQPLEMSAGVVAAFEETGRVRMICAGVTATAAAVALINLATSQLRSKDKVVSVFGQWETLTYKGIENFTSMNFYCVVQ